MPRYQEHGLGIRDARGLLQGAPEPAGMTTSLLPRLHLLLLIALFFVPQPASADDFYGVEQLHIKEILTRKNGDVEISYHPMAETLYHCPGANVKITPKGYELSFVRSWYKTTPKVDYPAVYDKERKLSVLTVPAAGKDVLIRSGTKLVKLEQDMDLK